MDLSFLAAADVALATTVAMLTFIGTNLARRAWPALDGRAVLVVAFGLALVLTVLLLLYAGTPWNGVAVGRAGLVTLVGGALSILSAESYKSQLVHRAQTKAGLR